MQIPEDYLKDVFDAADLDSDGQIALRELNLSSQLGRIEPQLAVAFQEAVENERKKDQKLSFEEFKEYVKNIPEKD